MVMFEIFQRNKVHKTPKSRDYCELHRNPDHVDECYGCQIIGTMFIERREDYTSRSWKCTFHNSFPELEHCANKGCATCKVFQRALWLRQITKQEADRLGSSNEPVWARLKPRGPANQPDETLLKIGIGDAQLTTATILCSNTLEQIKPPVNLNVGLSNAVVDEAKHWLENCHHPESSHTQCKNLPASRRNPSNLIECIPETDNLRLVEKSRFDPLVRYAALSYCWGDNEKLSEVEKERVRSHKTTEDVNDGSTKGGGNLKDRQTSFSASQLPPTIRDVIKLTLSLGIRYIWIDAMCILPGVGWNAEASRMHEVYGNAYVTLAICSSEITTDGLILTRQAWQHQIEACRLYSSGHWLSNLDLSLKEIRLKSPLSARGWTLQEERLSPRIIYVSGQRMYWSCFHAQHIEMGRYSPQRLLEDPDTLEWMRHPQEFLVTCRKQDAGNSYEQWLELVKVYAKRNLSNSTDRFLAFSGLAVRQIGLYVEGKVVKKEEYLAGLWRQSFAHGLAWSVEVADLPPVEPYSMAPSWSWASVPLCTDIITQPTFQPISEFELLEKPNLGKQGQSDEPLEVVQRGALIRSVQVRGPFRRFLQEGSTRKDWDVIQTKTHQKDTFDFSTCIAEFVHSTNPNTGRLVAYEPGKSEVVSQLDYLFTENESDARRNRISDRDFFQNLSCLQIGKSAMLLLLPLMEDSVTNDENEKEGEAFPTFRRVGVSTTVRQMFFASAELKTLVLV